MKSLKPLPSRTPIRTSIPHAGAIALSPHAGVIFPDAPDIRTLRTMVNISKKSKEHVPDVRRFRTSGTCSLDTKLSTSDKIHQKFKSEYNAFMNQLGSFDSEDLKPLVSPVHSSGSEGLCSDNSLGSKDLSPPAGSKDLSPLVHPTHDTHKKIIDRDSSPLVPDESLFSLFPKDTEILETEGLSIFNISDMELVSKNTVEVFFEDDFISYKKARENTDNVIFVLPSEIDSETGEKLDMLFIAYSKKQLYEDYIQTMKNRSSNLFFVLDLIEEESYHIPMSHIVRILEYPHPMYLVEQSSYSFHVYLTRPCKL
jgi:hypothetical protein